jgi:hypothetical protein
MTADDVYVGWWTASAERTLTEDIAAPPAAVRDFYVDLDNIMRVHPLVVSVRSISRTETAHGYVQTYRVHDRIPLGPVTLPTRYVARLDVPVAGAVLTEARQFPAVRLRGVVTFALTDGGTRLAEKIQITAPRVLAGVTVREAVNAHTTMLANIRSHFA